MEFIFQKVDGPRECTLSKNDIVVLFGSPETLANLTLSEKKTAISILTGYYNSSSSIKQLPAGVAVNMVILFGSTNKLFSYCVSEKILDTVLDIVTVNNVLRQVSNDIQVQFLDGYFKLSTAAYIKNCVSELSSEYLLETVSTAENLKSLSSTSVVHLITAISLWHTFPSANMESLLTYIAENPTEIFLQLPPSTLFGFIEGLLGILNEPKFEHGIPYSVIVKTLRPTMNPRMLSMLPRHAFDQLISVLGKNPALTKSLKVTDFNSIFRTLKTSPVLLTSVNSLNLANLLTTVATTPEIYNNVNSTLLIGTMQSISDYVPYTISNIPADVRTKLGFKKIITHVC